MAKNVDPTPAMHSPGSGISFVDLVVELYRGKWIILIILLVCLITAVTYTKVATRYYRAQVVVVPVGSSGSSSGLGAIASQIGIPGLPSGLGGDEGGISLRNEALAVLESRSFVTQFIQSNELLPVLFSDQWDDEANSWTAEAADNPPTPSRGQRFFSRKLLSVSEDRDTGIVTIAIVWHDRKQAADWTNQLVSELNRQLRAKSLETSRNKIQYLNRELANTNVTGIEQGIYRLIEAEMSKIAIANTRSEYAFRVIDPAIAPDIDDPVRPRRLLVLAGALFFGMFLSFLIVVLRMAVRLHR